MLRVRQEVEIMTRALFKELSLRGARLSLAEWERLETLNDCPSLREVVAEVGVPELIAHLELDPSAWGSWEGACLDLSQIEALTPSKDLAEALRHTFNPYGPAWSERAHAQRIRDLVEVQAGWDLLKLDWDTWPRSPSLWDGAHRLAAAWVLGLPTIRAKFLLGGLELATDFLREEGYE